MDAPKIPAVEIKPKVERPKSVSPVSAPKAVRKVPKY
jgi:hypothetical protein